MRPGEWLKAVPQADWHICPLPGLEGPVNIRNQAGKIGSEWNFQLFEAKLSGVTMNTILQCFLRDSLQSSLVHISFLLPSNFDLFSSSYKFFSFWRCYEAPNRTSNMFQGDICLTGRLTESCRETLSTSLYGSLLKPNNFDRYCKNFCQNYLTGAQTRGFYYFAIKYQFENTHGGIRAQGLNS